jgi:hypothetical protein
MNCDGEGSTNRCVILEEALSIFAERNANFARETNRSLKENKNLSFWIKMTCFELRFEGELVARVDPSSYIHANEKHYNYQLEKPITIPFQQASLFEISLAGFSASFRFGNRKMCLYLDKDKIMALFSVSHDISMYGKLIIDDGRLESELKEAIVTQEKESGVYNPFVHLGEEPWASVRYQFQYFQIRRSALSLSPSLPLCMDLQSLAAALPQCVNLNATIKLYKTLSVENGIIKHAQKRYLSVQGFSGSAGEAAAELFELSLENGASNSMRIQMPGFRGTTSWCCTLTEATTSILLSQIRHSWITLGGVNVSTFSWEPVKFLRIFNEGSELRMLLLYRNPRFDTEVEFSFEEPEMLNLFGDTRQSRRMFVGRLLRTLSPLGQRANATDLFDQATVKVVSVRFKMEDVRSRIEEVLGNGYCEKAVSG